MRHRLKVGFHITFPAEKAQDEVAKIVAQETKVASIQMLLKGLRPMNWNAIAGHLNDDFIKNLYTVSCTAWAVKVPRFVRNYLLKKQYEVRRIKH